MGRRRALVSDQDRIEAARLAALGLAVKMNLPGLFRVATGRPAAWHHFMDSGGGIVSERG